MLLLVCLACAGAVWLYFRSDFSRGGLLSREVATRTLSEHLARQFPKQKVLAVSNPFTLKKGQPSHIYRYEEAGVRGLQKGFGSDKVIVGFPKLLEGAAENPHAFSIPASSTTPVAFLLREGEFDLLAQKHQNCGLIISLIGIPTDLAKLQLWQKADGPKLAFLLPDLWMLGDKPAIAKAFKSGRIAAAVLNKPEAALEQMEAAVKDFHKRYLLVTPENIDEMMANYPQLFESSEPLPQDPGK